MTRPHPSATLPINASISFWLTFSSAIVSFCLATGQFAFAILIALSSLLLATPAAENRPKLFGQLRALFVFSAYLSALFPLWPEPLVSYLAVPLLLIVAIAAIAALNRRSFGGSRGFVSISAVAFLLFIRNVTLYQEFEAPIVDLGKATAFIAFMEIGLGLRHRDEQDGLHSEFVFGLLLVIVASFSLDSLLLAFLLAAFPIAGFLTRSHELAKDAREHVRTLPFPPTHSSSPRPSLTTIAALLLLPLILAAPLYLATLRLPFWTDYLPKDAPYVAKAIANRAERIAEASNINDDSVEDLANRVIDRDFLKDKARRIAASFQREDRNFDSLPTPQSQRPPRSANPSLETQSSRADARKTDYGLAPFTPSDTSYQSKSAPFETKSAAPRASERDSGSRFSTLPTPPRARLDQELPSNLINGNEASTQQATNQLDASLSSASQTAGLQNLQSEKIAVDESSDFENLLQNFDQPREALSQTLNLDGNDIPALLSEEPLVIVKLSDRSRQDRPRRLYLRSNVLNTASSSTFASILSSADGVSVDTGNNQTISLSKFRQSKAQGNSVTITATIDRYPTLPFPESFSSIQVLNTESIDVFPQKRIAIAKRSETPITYHIDDADLEVTDRERLVMAPRDTNRDQALEIPLEADDREYLQNLASRVGGSKTPARRFAYRFANYFAQRHPYSYFVDIPEGSGHAVVRWLKNEQPGLCTNYAAAFALLARSRGIPTRVVGGFATDEFDEKSGRYVMRQKNAHAWVEFIDESNRWIRFDPTPGITEAEIQRVEEYKATLQQFSLLHLLSAERINLANAATEPLSLSEASQQPDEIATTQQTTFPRTTSSFTPRDPELERPLAFDQETPSLPIETIQPTRRSSNPERPSATPPPERPSLPETQSPREQTQISNQNFNAIPQIAPSEQTPKKDLEPSDDSLLWIAILGLLALSIPALNLLRKTSREQDHRPSVERRLRLKAGQLLHRLETLLAEKSLEQDPVWQETRRALTAQRYGRETQAPLLEDLSVKVALLEKSTR